MVQRPHPTKQQEILDAAARLFAAHPYHEVRLDDVAAAAKVGKGTLYVYFTSKESMYLAIIRHGFGRVVQRIRAELSAPALDHWAQLRTIANGLVDFAFSFPDLYRIMRSGIVTPEDDELQRSRRELTDLITGVIRDGVRAGVLTDPHPELTAQFMLSFVRGAALYPPSGMTPEILRDHLLRVLRVGIAGAGS